MVARIASIGDAQTGRKFKDLPIPSPKHIIPNHPFYFFAFGKNVVDGKNDHFRESELNFTQTIESRLVAELSLAIIWADIFFILCANINNGNGHLIAWNFSEAVPQHEEGGGPLNFKLLTEDKDGQKTTGGKICLSWVGE